MIHSNLLSTYGMGQSSRRQRVFSAKPLFKCLSREVKVKGDTHLDYILKGYRKNAKLLVNKILSRIMHATSHSPSREANNPGLHSRRRQTNYHLPPLDVQDFRVLVFLMDRLNFLHQDVKATTNVLTHDRSCFGHRYHCSPRRYRPFRDIYNCSPLVHSPYTWLYGARPYLRKENCGGGLPLSSAES